MLPGDHRVIRRFDDTAHLGSFDLAAPSIPQNLTRDGHRQGTMGTTGGLRRRLDF